jgi:tRNA G10  N-methylase Trm11
MPVIADMLAAHGHEGMWVLDPFAGVGGVHALHPRFETVGVEIEPEWASAHERTIVGNALDLPFAAHTFDAVVTSPTYGNRMADHHEARDGSKRITYRHRLGRPLSADNTGQLQWGDKYREFHVRAWSEVARVLRSGGLFVLNVSDHVRKGSVVPVIDWHVSAIEALGMTLLEHRTVPTPRMRFGANGAARVDHESVVVFRR